MFAAWCSGVKKGISHNTYYSNKGREGIRRGRGSNGMIRGRGLVV